MTIEEYDARLLGEEQTRVNALPLEQRFDCLVDYWEHFDTAADLSWPELPAPGATGRIRGTWFAEIQAQHEAGLGEAHDEVAFRVCGRRIDIAGQAQSIRNGTPSLAKSPSEWDGACA